MRRAMYFVMVFVVILLGACNTEDIEDSYGSSEILYTHSRELKQNFEGVKLTMTYAVLDAGDAVRLEVTGTLINGFSSRIYYRPTFIVEDKNNVQYAGETVFEFSLAPENQWTFTEEIELPANVYAANDRIRFFVPAVFTQSGSTNSGDALGETVWWELPLK